MTDGFDDDKVNLHQRGAVDQSDRLGRHRPDVAGSWSPRRRRWVAIVAVVALVGAFVALLTTGEADAPAEPAGMIVDG